MDRLKLAGATILLTAMATTAAAAQDHEIGYPKDSLGYQALVDKDFARAEAQLRSDARVADADPAKLINLGTVFARTGRAAEAERMFAAAMRAGEVDLILADGRVVSSREAAELALRSLRRR